MDLIAQFSYGNYYLVIMPPKKRKKNDDHLFRKSMQNERIVKGLLRWLLKPSIATTIDFSTLAIKKDLWVDTDLSEHIADIVYEACMRNSKKHVYFLFEHKSKSDKKIIIQNSRYINMIWKTHQEQHEDSEREPQVYAVIIYNGNRIWNIDNSRHNETAYFKDSLIPKVEWIFFDLKHDEYEIDSKQYLLKAFINSLKYVNTKEFFDKIPETLRLFRRRGTDQEYLSVIINYFYSAIDPKDNERFFDMIDTEYSRGGTMKTFTDILQEWGEKRGFEKGMRKGVEQGVKLGVKQGVKQGAEQGVQKGRKQGITEGENKQKQIDMVTIAKQLLKKNMSIREISAITGLSLRKIQNLKNGKNVNLSRTSKRSKKLPKENM